MTKKEIQHKIQTLIDSGQGENVYIALYMMVNQLNMDLLEAIKSLEPIDYEKEFASPNDFYCSVRIANIWVEYEFIEGYVPYMGTAATASRMVSYYDAPTDSTEIIDSLAEFLPIQDEDSPERVREIVLEDYQELAPLLLRLLDGEKL
ncbi:MULTISPECIES: hypothetical protein [unclassified Aureispira]|uniref:hypothetical protein n=1 Tax=unclassified Aureispira TaxID=2649989 RepID=UPI00069719EE|nr:MULTISPECIES: hypothetical protein [unclassified Aureispira]WMX13681.1 hypothetical protein QP953_22775 [Aureispira sp. CCB-E]